MKKAFFAAVFLIILFCFAGCEKYDQEEADVISDKGTEMMQAWLDENMPEAQMTGCEAYTNTSIYYGNLYLTDYAIGTIVQAGEETGFAIDTVTGSVYFEMDEDVQEELNRIAETYLYEAMGISPENNGSPFECHVLAPYREGTDENAVPAYYFNYGFDHGLPAGVEDLESFVRNPQSRPLLYIRNAEITLPDDTDLSAYTLEKMERFAEQCGMFLGYVTVNNTSQTFTTASREWLTKTDFAEHGCWLEKDGVRLTGHTRVRKEERNHLTGKITATDRCFDPEQDIVFEETQTGYRYYMPNDDWQEVFTIRASEGAKMLEHDYMEYFYSDVEGFLDDKYDSDEEDGTETVWLESSNGVYTLASKKNQFPLTFYRSGRLEIIDPS